MFSRTELLLMEVMVGGTAEEEDQVISMLRQLMEVFSTMAHQFGIKVHQTKKRLFSTISV